jgi:hypothetical protein
MSISQRLKQQRVIEIHRSCSQKIRSQVRKAFWTLPLPYTHDLHTPHPHVQGFFPYLLCALSLSSICSCVFESAKRPGPKYHRFILIFIDLKHIKRLIQVHNERSFTLVSQSAVIFFGSNFFGLFVPCFMDSIELAYIDPSF